MRLHYGAVPENKDFIPEAEGWRDIREPGPVALQFIAIPVAIGLFFMWAIFLISFQREAFSSQAFMINGDDLVLLLLLIPAHELLHAVVHPGWGLSSSTLIGVWLSRGLFYAHFEGEMSRDRFLLVFIMPYIVLGALPTILIAIIPELMQSLFWFSLIGSVLASGDFVGAGLILFQIPRSGIVRNKGWKTYWKAVV